MMGTRKVLQVYGSAGLDDVNEYEFTDTGGTSTGDAVRDALWHTGVWPQPIEGEPNFRGWQRVVINIGPALDDEEEEHGNR